MTDDLDRDNRKNKKKHNSIAKSKHKNFSEISEEQRFISKSKKAFKHKIEDIRSDELWEDWEDMNQ